MGNRDKLDKSVGLEKADKHSVGTAIICLATCVVSQQSDLTQRPHELSC